MSTASLRKQVRFPHLSRISETTGLVSQGEQLTGLIDMESGRPSDEESDPPAEPTRPGIWQKTLKCLTLAER